MRQHCHDPGDAVKGAEHTLDFRQHYGELLTVLGADYVVELAPMSPTCAG